MLEDSNLNGYTEPLLYPTYPRKSISQPPQIKDSLVRKRITSVLSIIAAGCFSFCILLLVLGLSYDDRNYLETSSFSKVKLISTSINVSIAPSILYGIAILVGLVLCLFGYKFIKPAFFLAGFIAGAFIFYEISAEIFASSQWFGVATAVAIVVGGIIFGFLVLCFYTFGLFLLGVCAGLLFAIYCQSAFLHLIYPENPDITLYVAMAIFGLAFGCLVLYLERPIIIIFTSWIGAYACIRGIGYFAGDYPSMQDMKSTASQNVNGKSTNLVPKEWYIYFVATAVLFVFGTLIQFLVTSSNLNHSEPKGDHHHPKHKPKHNYYGKPVVNGSTSMV